MPPSTTQASSDEFWILCNQYLICQCHSVFSLTSWKSRRSHRFVILATLAQSKVIVRFQRSLKFPLSLRAVFLLTFKWIRWPVHKGFIVVVCVCVLFLSLKALTGQLVQVWKFFKFRRCDANLCSGFAKLRISRPQDRGTSGTLEPYILGKKLLDIYKIKKKTLRPVRNFVFGYKEN